MGAKKILLLMVILLGGLHLAAVPDNNPKKNALNKKAKIINTELKRSVQFNFGVPLPNEVLTGSKKSITVAEEGFANYDFLQEKYSEKLSVHPAAVTNKPMYNFIEDWYGVRYVYGGTSKSGVDCSSFVQQLIDAVFKVDLQRTAANQFQTTEFVNQEDLKEGDLVFFKIKVHRISHVGVYLQNGRFVHASSSRGVMISNLNDDYWSRYYAGGGRVKM